MTSVGNEPLVKIKEYPTLVKPWSINPSLLTQLSLRDEKRKAITSLHHIDSARGRFSQEPFGQDIAVRSLQYAWALHSSLWRACFLFPDEKVLAQGLAFELECRQEFTADRELFCTKRSVSLRCCTQCHGKNLSQQALRSVTSGRARSLPKFIFVQKSSSESENSP